MPNDEPRIIKPDRMLTLSNLLLEIERKINRLEHDRLDILGFRDPVLNDDKLSRLNILGKEISQLKNEHNKMATELFEMKSAYYEEISKAISYPIKFE